MRCGIQLKCSWILAKGLYEQVRSYKIEIKNDEVIFWIVADNPLCVPVVIINRNRKKEI